MRKLGPTRPLPTDVQEGGETAQARRSVDREVRTGNAFVDGYTVSDRSRPVAVGDDGFMSRPLFGRPARPYD